MVDVPSSLLPKLRCSLCDGYLSVSPVMVSTESQICGRCFRILPEQAKRKYVRETGLEAVAEILTFPCRYRGQGCAFRVHFDEAEDHERECPHRRFAQTEETYGSNDETDPLIGDALSRERSLSVKCQSKELRLEGKYSLRQNGGLMKYTMDISAGEGRALCLQSEHYIKPGIAHLKTKLPLRGPPLLNNHRSGGVGGARSPSNSYHRHILTLFSNQSKSPSKARSLYETPQRTSTATSK